MHGGGEYNEEVKGIMPAMPGPGFTLQATYKGLTHITIFVGRSVDAIYI